MDKFKLIIVEDVPLELKGTEGIIRNEIPEAEVIGTAEDEVAYWRLIKQQQPDLVLLDLDWEVPQLLVLKFVVRQRNSTLRCVSLSLQARYSTRNYGSMYLTQEPMELFLKVVNC